MSDAPSCQDERQELFISYAKLLELREIVEALWMQADELIAKYEKVLHETGDQNAADLVWAEVEAYMAAGNAAAEQAATAEQETYRIWKIYLECKHDAETGSEDASS